MKVFRYLFYFQKHIYISFIQSNLALAVPSKLIKTKILKKNFKLN